MQRWSVKFNHCATSCVTTDAAHSARHRHQSSRHPRHQIHLFQMALVAFPTAQLISLNDPHSRKYKLKKKHKKHIYEKYALELDLTFVGVKFRPFFFNFSSFYWHTQKIVRACPYLYSEFIRGFGSVPPFQTDYMLKFWHLFDTKT